MKLFIAFLLTAISSAAFAQWQSTNDYPAAALRERREGTTEIAVTVNAHGKAENCTITKSSGHTDLDAAACDMVVKRATFRPATDKDGTAIVSTYSNKIVWKIPR